MVNPMFDIHFVSLKQCFTIVITFSPYLLWNMVLSTESFDIREINVSSLCIFAYLTYILLTTTNASCCGEFY